MLLFRERFRLECRRCFARHPCRRRAAVARAPSQDARNGRFSPTKTTPKLGETPASPANGVGNQELPAPLPRRGVSCADAAQSTSQIDIVRVWQALRVPLLREYWTIPSPSMLHGTGGSGQGSALGTYVYPGRARDHWQNPSGHQVQWQPLHCQT